jgi:hypothetical protein
VGGLSRKVHEQSEVEKIDPKDARNIIGVDLTRDECEGIYAMCHVVANGMGDRGEILPTCLSSGRKNVE